MIQVKLFISGSILFLQYNDVFCASFACSYKQRGGYFKYSMKVRPASSFSNKKKNKL